MEEWELQALWPEIRWRQKGNRTLSWLLEWQESSDHTEELAGGSDYEGSIQVAGNREEGEKPNPLYIFYSASMDQSLGNSFNNPPLIQ